MTQYPSKMEFSKKQLSRFWAKVEKTDSCWLWTASLCGGGYGKFWISGPHKKLWRVSRLSWVIHCGPIPDGICVLHKCDNRRCLNPDHLFLGTKSDNAQDAVRKGRWNRPSGPYPKIQGGRHGQSKLTETEARQIIASDLSGAELSRKFGVGGPQISRIKHGLRWGHLQ